MSTVTPSTRKTTRRQTGKAAATVEPATTTDNDAPHLTPDHSTYDPAHKTPAPFDARSYTKTPAGKEDTPTRQARLDERNELQSLNNRLELYILKQRERDASLSTKDRELDNIKQQALDEIGRVKALHINELNQLRSTREQQSNSITQLEANELQLITQYNDLKSKYDALEQQHSAAESAQHQSVAAQRELQGQLNALQTQYKLVQDELAALKKYNKDADKQHADLIRKVQTAESDRASIQQQYSNLQADHETRVSQMNSEVESLRTQMTTRLTEATISSVDREKLVAQYTAEVQRVREHSHADKENAIAILKQLYDEKLTGYRTELERSGHDLETEKSRSRQLRVQLKSTDEYVAELQSQLTAQTQRAEQAEQALINEKNNPELQQVIAVKNEQIRRIKQSFKRKDAEFDELMDVKVLLDSELQAYRQLLESEEVRLELSDVSVRGSKRSKVTHVELQCTHMDGALVVLSDVDVTNKTIVIRSNTVDNVDIGGYSLKSVSTGLTYKLPSKSLSIGERFNVVIQLNKEKSAVLDTTNTAVWKVKSFEGLSDTIQLMDRNENVISTAVVQQDNSAVVMPGEDMVDDSVETVPAENKCVVM